ncbi:MAG TPA: hypothetical protein VJR22_05020 [Candidatus Nitrosotalea sp.]|nr:hypothetical protein [Nitrososphaerota archaeon]HKU33188.1 hypothetical protein [Candidatus Nitrosotalea sp.]
MSDKVDEESEILKGMFEEVMKMVHQKQIKIETIIQKAIEQGTISQDSFNRMYKMLDEYGKKKQWV